MPFLKTLNPRQLEAVTHGDGPLLILAGAGSGKTKVLTSRIAYLVNYKNVAPENIIAVTFTNKAAGEMRERLSGLIGERAERLCLGTFHSIGLKILKNEMYLAGIRKGFTIIDEEDQIELIGKILGELALKKEDYPPKAIAAYINNAKNEYLSPNECMDMAEDALSQTYAKVFSVYNQRLKKLRFLDFGDLICDPINLFMTYPDILKKYHSMFTHILVDEYQDTNKAQYVLTSLLSSASRNILAVGDPDQAIYGWRGADISNILNFERDYPDATIFRLEQNYRSTKNILSAANSVIKNNSQRMEKTLWTEHQAGPKISVFEAYDPQKEAELVIEQIRALQRENPSLKYKDFALLYRTNFQSRAIEEQLIRAGIPYILIGGFKFYDRAEIKDTLAYLKLALNPDDSLSLKRVLATPKRGIGDKGFQKIEEFAREWQLPIYDAIKRAYQEGLLRRTSKLDELLGAIDEFISGISTGRVPFYELTQKLLESSGYLSVWLNDPENEKRLENIEEFISSMADFESKRSGADLQDFLEHVALISDIDNMDDEKNHLTLMTIHAAKGLEFPVVFILGLNEGVFPHQKSSTPERLEEERRLCYVGMTRAQKMLYLSSCRYRMTGGEFQYQQRSRFIDEIDPEYIEISTDINQEAV